MDMAKSLSEWTKSLPFFNFLLLDRPNVLQDHIEINSHGILPKADHLLYAIPLSFVVYFTRILIEKNMLALFGINCGLKLNKFERKTKDIRENTAKTRKNGKVEPCQIIKESVRKRQEQEKPIELMKFYETGWRLVHHTFSVVFGLTVLWDKDWLWNINQCWHEFPNQRISSDIFWYYVIHLSIYLAVLAHLLAEMKKRGDFLEMIIHHTVTVLLFLLSWMSNTIRIGTLVLIVHDFADIFLEAGRIAKYLQKQKAVNIFAVLFFITWFFTRIFIFPFYILKNIWLDAPSVILTMPVIQFMVLLLHILLGLHLLWTFEIIKIIHKSVLLGKAVEDSNSSASSSDVE